LCERFDDRDPVAPGDGERIALALVDATTASARPVGATIRRRGSLREFSHAPVNDRKFVTVLDRALRGIPSDLSASGVQDLIVPCCLVHGVEGVPSGSYRYRAAEASLERVGDVDRETAGHVALDQSVGGDAAANVTCWPTSRGSSSGSGTGDTGRHTSPAASRSAASISRRTRTAIPAAGDSPSTIASLPTTSRRRRL
jgi:hypothetical protein